jgi:hypothetical protein
VVALGAVVAIVPSLAWTQGAGRCIRVETPWPVVLPDGSAHQAGTLRLCLRHEWTPVTGLHEIRVDGTSLGLFMSRIGKSEGRSERDPLVVFQRNVNEQHRLVGYAWPEGEVMRTFTLRQVDESPREIPRGTARKRNKRLPLIDSDETKVLVAAVGP